MTNTVTELHDSARRVLSGLDLAADEQATWARIAELGWLMIATDEDLGGLGMGLPGACALHMELGRRLATVPFLPALLSIDAIANGSVADREVWLERLTTGQEYVATSMAKSAVSVVHGEHGEENLTGVAAAIQSADRAGHVLVCTMGGDCVALVPIAQPGLIIVPRPTWDTTRRLFDLHFADVLLEERFTLARGTAAQALTARIATQRDFALAAEAVGGADALLELTVQYLGTRNQFGRPLALFQALKHRCADLKALIAGAEALVLDSLGRIGMHAHDAGTGAGAERMGKQVKLLACAAYARVAEEALQLHGGIGMTSEHVCHLFLKRAMLNEHLGREQDHYEADLAASLLVS
jgi:alkylation response protein AidB-like acyl-CoA dehydrogenase